MAFPELAFLFLLIFPPCCAQNTYYVSTSPDTSCPGEPCHTLTEYTEQADLYFTSNSTFIFLPGNHTLENFVSVTDVSNLTLLGDSSSLPQVTSRIICSQPASIVLYQVSELYISGLAFVSCGRDSLTGAAVIVSMAVESEISNCIFQNNINTNVRGRGGGAIAVVDSNLSLLENTFESNYAISGGGVHIEGSIVSLVRNTFINNDASTVGGSVFVGNSTIDFCENNFTDNYAGNNGAAVFVDFNSACTTNFTRNSFVSNFGRGWVLYVDSTSTGSFTENMFANNSGNVVYGSSSQNISVYYVTPASTLPCPGEPCHTLSEFVQQADTYFTSDTTFVFLPGNHTLENGLLVRGITSLTLLGDSSIPQTVITCTRAVSLAFISIDEVQIRGLTFMSCGDFGNPAVGFTSIRNGEISNCQFENSTNVDGSGGNGGAVSVVMSNISLLESRFERNTAVNGGGFLASQSTVTAARNIFVGNSISGGGGAVALIASTVSFVQNTVVNNTAEFGGGVVAADCVATFEENDFIGNVAPFTGGGVSTIGGNVTFLGRNNFISNYVTMLFGAGLAVRSGHAELRGETRFTMNSAQIIGGAVIIFDSSVIFSGNLTIENSTSLYGGGLMAAQSVLEFSGDIFFQRNRAIYGAGIYVTTSNISFSGNTSFSSNSANFGGGIYAAFSNLRFEGMGSFTENSATNGGGLLLTADSKCFFLPNTDIRFISNSAIQNGGAINVEDSIPLAYCFDTSSTFSLTILGECFFQLPTSAPVVLSCTSDIAALNVRLYFEGNTAFDGGSDLYGGAVDSCRFTNIALCRNSTLEGVSDDCCLGSGDVFDLITHREQGTVSISSDPLRPCICNNGNQNCTQSTISSRVFPGGTLTVSVIGSGQRNGNVPAVIHPLPSEDRIRFNSLEYTQRTGSTCTNLEYTVFSSVVSGKENITLFAEGPCPAFGSISILLDVLHCPPGFELSETTQACVCDRRLIEEKLTVTCNIENGTILHPQNAQFWVSFDNASNGLILHSDCPFDYCSSEEQYIDVGDIDMQCNYNRTGKLCGKCREGFSLILGSSRCLQCSNSYLGLLVMFAFAGIALVLLLFVLRLTVAVGTINGLIFYANVVQVNSALFLPGSNISLIVLAWLNLDLGIETCFYDGMDAYAKTWLQFVFPIYVWALVGLIILVSHFSSMVARHLGNNPIAVLATLFFLSYAKFLRTIISALSITFLEYPDGNVAVWRPDGNIRYLSGKHIPLFITAMASLLFVFLPYTLLLFLEQWLQMKSKWMMLSWIKKTRVKFFLDAYRAPYADKHRYWTGLLFLVRCILFLAFATVGDASANLFAVSSAVIALLTLGFVVRGVYRSPYIGALEASFLLNLGILAAASYHVTLVGGNQTAVTFTSVSIAYATFVGIIFYHAYEQIKTTMLWSRLTKKGLQYSHKMCPNTKQDISNSGSNTERSTDMETTFDSGSEPAANVSTTWVDLREPLLEEN